MNGREMKGVHNINMVAALLLLLSVGVLGGGGGAEAQLQQQHHLVGESKGWDSSADIALWSSNRLFRVGDNILFAYAAAQEFISEVGSREEFETCDVSNPIMMYTDGINKVPLEKEGPRYFISGRPESCTNGLKLHVDVLPQSASEGKVPTTKEQNAGPVWIAEGPTPSASAGLQRVSFLIWIGLALFYQFGL